MNETVAYPIYPNEGARCNPLPTSDDNKISCQGCKGTYWKTGNTHRCGQDPARFIGKAPPIPDKYAPPPSKALSVTIENTRYVCTPAATGATAAPKFKTAVMPSAPGRDGGYFPGF